MRGTRGGGNTSTRLSQLAFTNGVAFSKSGDTVQYSAKDDKGNAVKVETQKNGEETKTTVKSDKGTLTASAGKNHLHHAFSRMIWPTAVFEAGT